MQVELITRSDLENFKKELLQEITAVIQQGSTDQTKEWLKSGEARAMLKVSNGTLQNLRIKNLLHPTKVAGVYYYRLSEIKALLTNGTEL